MQKKKECANDFVARASLVFLSLRDPEDLIRFSHIIRYSTKHLCIGWNSAQLVAEVLPGVVIRMHHKKVLC